MTEKKSSVWKHYPPSASTIWYWFHHRGLTTYDIEKRFRCHEYEIYNIMGRTAAQNRGKSDG